ncbi:MAG: RluA family pseudouridine synthase [Bdellovibrionia bacterium]
MKPEIILEEDEFIVVNKPVGLSVHNGTPSEPCVLDFYPSYHLAHRLDKETSGVLVLTKNNPTQMMTILSSENSQKYYLALLRGSITGPTTFEWNQKLTDKAEGRKNPQGKASDRLPCSTIVTIDKQNKFMTLATCLIKTGRQHQIRKHAAINKHPIVGDPRYNDPTYNKKIATLYNTDRMFLHAHRLIMPYKNKTLTLEAPLDNTFQKTINTLSAAALEG